MNLDQHPIDFLAGLEDDAVYHLLPIEFSELEKVLIVGMVAEKRGTLKPLGLENVEVAYLPERLKYSFRTKDKYISLEKQFSLKLDTHTLYVDILSKEEKRNEEEEPTMYNTLILVSRLPIPASYLDDVKDYIYISLERGLEREDIYRFIREDFERRVRKT